MCVGRWRLRGSRRNSKDGRQKNIPRTLYAPVVVGVPQYCRAAVPFRYNHPGDSLPSRLRPQNYRFQMNRFVGVSMMVICGGFFTGGYYDSPRAHVWAAIVCVLKFCVNYALHKVNSTLMSCVSVAAVLARLLPPPGHGFLVFGAILSRSYI